MNKQAKRIIKYTVYYLIIIALCSGAIYYYYRTHKIIKNEAVTETDIFISAYTPPGVENQQIETLKNIKKTHSKHIVSAPIFLYHYIRNPEPGDTQVVKSISTTPYNFEAQIKDLISQGYRSITFSTLIDAIQNNKSLPSKSFLLTFDDGYRDFYENAYPIIKKYHLKATVFIITNLVEDPRYLSWNQIKGMYDSGDIEFGSHTLSHANLTKISLTQAQKEINQSKRLIERHLGHNIDIFCYPFGIYNNQTAELVKQAGYNAAVSADKGQTHSNATLFSLYRLRAGNNDKINF